MESARGVACPPGMAPRGALDRSKERRSRAQRHPNEAAARPSRTNPALGHLGASAEVQTNPGIRESGRTQPSAGAKRTQPTGNPRRVSARCARFGTCAAKRTQPRAGAKRTQPTGNPRRGPARRARCATCAAKRTRRVDDPRRCGPAALHIPEPAQDLVSGRRRGHLRGGFRRTAPRAGAGRARSEGWRAACAD